MVDTHKILDLITAKEVAQILKLNPQVVLRKLLAGEIPGYKLGKEWRVSRRQLVDWLEQHSNQKGRSISKIAGAFFASDGKLKSIPAQRKKRIAVLEHLLKEFEPNRVYPESEINEIIRRFHPDVCTLRREFIDEKMMFRKDSNYRVNGSYIPRDY